MKTTTHNLIIYILIFLLTILTISTNIFYYHQNKKLSDELVNLNEKYIELKNYFEKNLYELNNGNNENIEIVEKTELVSEAELNSGDNTSDTIKKTSNSEISPTSNTDNQNSGEKQTSDNSNKDNMANENIVYTNLDSSASTNRSNKPYDMETDSSFTKFVSANVPFNDLKYEPSDLVAISGEHIYDTKGNSKLRKEAVDNLQKMSNAFYDDFGKSITVVSAYRSYEYQAGIKARGCSDLYCAKAGYSEHQSGLAVDLWEASSESSFLSNSNYAKYFEWMKQNAHKYGFHNTYQKGLEIDTYVVEPWHWRYMGVNLATYLHDNNMTIAEYYNS